MHGADASRMTARKGRPGGRPWSLSGDQLLRELGERRLAAPTKRHADAAEAEEHQPPRCRLRNRHRGRREGGQGAALRREDESADLRIDRISAEGATERTVALEGQNIADGAID